MPGPSPRSPLRNRKPRHNRSGEDHDSESDNMNTSDSIKNERYGSGDHVDSSSPPSGSPQKETSPRGVTTRAQTRLYPNFPQYFSSDESSLSPGSFTTRIGQGSPNASSGPDHNSSYESHGSPWKSSPSTISPDQHPKGRQSPPAAGKHPKANKDTLFGMNPDLFFSVLGVCVFVIVMSIWWALGSNPPPPTPRERQNLGLEFIEQSRGLKYQFPSQTRSFWKEVLVPIKNVLSSTQSPPRPAMVVMAAHGRDIKTADCISHHLSQIVASVFNHTGYTLSRIDARSHFKDATGDEAKEQLDTMLQKRFLSHPKVAGLSHLQSLPWQAASLLHGYLDHENAPYKDAIFLVTVQCPEGATITSSFVEEFLEKHWGDYGRDNVLALFSRILNNVVVVQHERDHNEQCP